MGQIMTELVSFPLRYTFREFCVFHLVVRDIDDMFCGCGIQPGELDSEKLQRLSGARRTRVEQYYASIDWTSKQSVQDFLNVLNFVLGQSFTQEGEEAKDKLRELCTKDGLRVEGNTVSFHEQSSVKGNIKNLIFAANGPKPEIVLLDSVNNDIQIVRNNEFCLIYDKPIPERGLMWEDLVEWWREQSGNAALDRREQERTLYNRLLASLSHNEPEQLLFRAYMEHFREELGELLPALIPQVYLHYDPYTLRQLSNGKRLARQRMDFLLLFSHQKRVVLEVDGKQHYSVDNIAKPNLYAEMVAEDRRLKLAGYEVYRFGGYELQSEADRQVVINFFRALFKRHSFAS